MKRIKKLFTMGLASLIALLAIGMTASADADLSSSEQAAYTMQPTYTIDIEDETWVPTYESANIIMPRGTAYTFNKTIPSNGVYTKILNKDPGDDNKVLVTINTITADGTVTVRLINNDDGGVAYASLSAGYSALFDVTGEFTVYLSADYTTTVQGSITTYQS